MVLEYRQERRIGKRATLLMVTFVLAWAQLLVVTAAATFLLDDWNPYLGPVIAYVIHGAVCFGLAIVVAGLSTIAFPGVPSRAQVAVQSQLLALPISVVWLGLSVIWKLTRVFATFEEFDSWVVMSFPMAIGCSAAIAVALRMRARRQACTSATPA